MRKCQLLCSALLLIPLLSIFVLPTSAAQSQQADTARSINWAINTAPPFHIVDGTYRNQGICDGLMQAVEDTLNDYQVSRTLMPQTRIGLQFQRNVNQCFPCMIYRPNIPTPDIPTENDSTENAWLSQPTHRYAPHGIITTPAHATTMREHFGNPVSLARVLESNDFRLGHPAGRRYGLLQSVLDGHEGDNNYRVIRTGEHATTAIIEMILASRIDYTIDYHSLLSYHQKTASGALEFVPLAENHDTQVLGAIGCTNNAWGREVIAAIDANLNTIRQHPAFLHSLSLWFEDDAHIPLTD